MSELYVKSARHAKSYILEITFSDGYEKILDFAPFIFSNGHPDHDQYKLEKNFLKFQVIDGNLNWDDYTMIFPVEDLYKGNIVK